MSHHPVYRYATALAATLVASPMVLLAHHGQEFLVVQDSSVPSLWSGTVYGGLEWSRDGRDDEISAEPGILLGIGAQMALGLTVGDDPGAAHTPALAGAGGDGGRIPLCRRLHR
jgi:hypothetical protein